MFPAIGVLKMKDILSCFPFEDPCVVISVEGKYVLEALENAVGKYPALEGRFPQVSGIEFEFDPVSLMGKRVTSSRDTSDACLRHLLTFHPLFCEGKARRTEMLKYRDRW